MKIAAYFFLVFPIFVESNVVAFPAILSLLNEYFMQYAKTVNVVSHAEKNDAVEFLYEELLKKRTDLIPGYNEKLVLDYRGKDS